MGSIAESTSPKGLRGSDREMDMHPSCLDVALPLSSRTGGKWSGLKIPFDAVPRIATITLLLLLLGLKVDIGDSWSRFCAFDERVCLFLPIIQPMLSTSSIGALSNPTSKGQ